MIKNRDQLDTMDCPARLKERERLVGLFFLKSLGFCKICLDISSYFMIR